MAKLEGELKAKFFGNGQSKMDQDSVSEENEVQLSLTRNDRHCADDLYDVYSELWKGGKVTALAQDIVDHETLVSSLLDTASASGDIAVIRGCVLILEVLCGDSDSALELMQHHSIFKKL